MAMTKAVHERHDCKQPGFSHSDMYAFVCPVSLFTLNGFALLVE